VTPTGEPLVVDVVPWGPTPEAAQATAREALQGPPARAILGDSEYRLLSVVTLPAGGEDDLAAEPSLVRATIYDYTNERTVTLDAPSAGPGEVSVADSARPPLPTGDEHTAAIRVIEGDPELGPALRAGRLAPYRPMPPLLVEELPDGRIERTVTVGLEPAEGDSGHEIVGVKLARGEVVRFDEGAPRGALAAERLCGTRAAGQRTAQGVPGAARVTIRRGGAVLWTFVAVRPAASSGRDGSGIELRSVAYRGKRVLRRAHVPILNVRYDRDRCGPFRDWQNQEGMFRAHGDDVAPGFRLCPRPAQTFLDTGNDRGNFLGVAIYVAGDEVVLVSELEAGWYRYVSEWRLAADGTIRPRFGFGAVGSSCVCVAHHHHAYWRLDFDVAGAGRTAVREFNDPPLVGTRNWHTLRYETCRACDRSHRRRWRVVNLGGDEGYTLVPGPHDGRSDSFGVGDLWALRRRGGQLDDAGTDAKADLDRLINRESIREADVVLWYAAHFRHRVGHEGAHVVGPELVPVNW
jgi:hypothetical protein